MLSSVLNLALPLSRAGIRHPSRHGLLPRLHRRELHHGIRSRSAVPAVYAAETGRGYTDEQEQRYGLVRNLSQLAAAPLFEAIDGLLAEPAEHWQAQRRVLLADSIDVARFVADAIVDYPRAPRQTLAVGAA